MQSTIALAGYGLRYMSRSHLFIECILFYPNQKRQLEIVAVYMK